MAKKVATDLPYNLDAEKACLGSALLSFECANSMLNTLIETDFYLGKHQILYRAMYTLLNEKHAPVDSVTVTEELINMKELENIGGVDYLKECSDAMVSFGALDFYIAAVKNQSVLRNMLQTIRDIDNKYRTSEIKDINSFLIESDAKFRESLSRRRVSDFESVKDMADRIRNLINSAKGGEDNLVGVTTGYPSLNGITQGFQHSTMTIIGGRPGMGKTSFALNLAYNVAARGKVTVAIFSLEMDKETLYKRLLASRANVPFEHIQNGYLNDTERVKLANSINALSETNIYIDDTRGATLGDIITKSRKLYATNPDLGLIVVDHIGIIGSDGTLKASESRQNEVQKLSMGLRNLGGELKVPMLVLCQLTRKAEDRDNKRPMLSDLRESGSIEQDADVVMFLYRDDYYDNTGAEKKKSSKAINPDEMTKSEKDKEAVANLPGGASYMEVIIAKNRNGKTGKRGFFFYKDYGRFDEPPSSFVEAYDKSFNNE